MAARVSIYGCSARRCSHPSPTCGQTACAATVDSCTLSARAIAQHTDCKSGEGAASTPPGLFSLACGFEPLTQDLAAPRATSPWDTRHTATSVSEHSRARAARRYTRSISTNTHSWALGRKTTQPSTHACQHKEIEMRAQRKRDTEWLR